MQTIQTILFDLGGVLIDLDLSKTINAMKQLGIPHFDKILVDAYVCEDFLGAYEKGELSTSEFRNKIRQLAHNPNLSDAKIDTAWNLLLGVAPDYKLELLQQLKKKHKVYALSNTNELHVKQIEATSFGRDGHQVTDYFDNCFYSNEMNLAKPNSQIFKEVIAQTHIIPQETYYIDDSPQNIEIGKQIGFQTYLFTQGENLYNCFREWNLK